MDVLGWIGGLLVAGGYALVSARRIDPHSRAFQGMNVLGGVLLGTACLVQGSLPSACLNAVWVTVGLKTMYAMSASRLNTRHDATVGSDSRSWAPHPQPRT